MVVVVVVTREGEGEREGFVLVSFLSPLRCLC